MLDELVWLGHDAFLFRGPPTIYVDPVRIADGPPADLILVTHGHYDHCSPTDVGKIATPDTVIVAPADCVTCLAGFGSELKIVEPTTKFSLLGVKVEAMPAYTRRRRMHGRANGWLGYRIEVQGDSWYHAGDTDFIIEMQDLDADVACLPVSGGTVMNPVEAAAAAEAIDPGVALPMHYGTFMGCSEDAEAFRERTSVEVQILEADLVTG